MTLGTGGAGPDATRARTDATRARPVGEALAELLGDAAELAERHASPYRSTHALEEVVVLAGGARLELVLKGSGAGRAGRDRVRPRLVRDAEREAWAYESVLPRAAMGTPRFFGRLAPGTLDERLVIEKIRGHPLTDVGGGEAWRAAARWLGEFHAWGRAWTSSAKGGGRLLRQSCALHRRWWTRAARRARALESEDHVRRLERLRPVHERAASVLARWPTTVVHGEFYPSNVLIEEGGPEPRVRPVDWESIGAGPALLDLAALTIGDWTDADRADFRRSWARAVGATDDAAIRTGLEAARLLNAMQWLGWSVSWQPPEQHQRDWLAEAEAAAARFDGLHSR